jgi:hypothetical protein
LISLSIALIIFVILPLHLLEKKLLSKEILFGVKYFKPLLLDKKLLVLYGANTMVSKTK